LAETIDGPDDDAILIDQGRNIHNHNDSRTIGPFDLDFGAIDSSDFAGQYSGHRALVMRQEAAVHSIKHVSSTEPLVGVPESRFASPEFGSVFIEERNHPCGIAGVNAGGIGIEQTLIAGRSPFQGFLELRNGGHRNLHFSQRGRRGA